MKERKVSDINYAVMALAMTFMTGTGGAISPVMQKMIEYFSYLPVSTVRMASSIVGLVGAIVSVPVSKMFDKYGWKFKTVMMTGCVIVTFAALPLILPDPVSFPLLMVSRFCYGASTGFFMMRMACFRALFANEPIKAIKWMGITGSVGSIASAIMSPIAGILGDVNWKYAYSVYLLGIVCLVLLMIFFVEPEKQAPKEEKTTEARAKLDPRVWIYVIILGLVTAFSYPIFTGMSTLITARGIGEAAVSGTVIMCYNIGQIVTSLTFGAQYKIFKKKIGFIGALGLGLGFVLITMAQTFIIAAIGAFLCGFGFIYFMIPLTRYAGDIADPTNKAFASTMVTASMSIAAFLSSYWITAAYKLGSMFTFLGTDAERTYLLTAIIFIAMAVIFFFKDIRPKESIAADDKAN